MKQLLAGLLLALPQIMFAQTLQLDQLGALDLRFEPALAGKLLPGTPTLGTMTTKPGNAYDLATPARIEQVVYLFEPGEHVNEGERFAIIRGPEMHHLLSEYKALKALYHTARDRLESGRALHENKAISDEQWFEINQQYYKTHLDYEHLHHFHELVVSADTLSNTIEIAAPASGHINYVRNGGGINRGQTLAEFIPATAIRLQLKIPASIQQAPTFLSTTNCRVAIDAVSQLAEGFYLSAWSAPPPANCALRFGQQLTVTPLYPIAHYRVPAEAVFRLGESTHVLIRKGETLNAVEVTLMGRSGPDLFLSGDAPLENSSVLVESVSAVQGILLGMGKE